MRTYFLIIALILTGTQASAWGFWAHKRINRMAVFTLPPEMLGLYKRHIAYLTEKATAPDMRRYAVQGEAFRHYIDIDKWGEYPFADLPRNWNDIQEQYWEIWVMHEGDSLQLSGHDNVLVEKPLVKFFGEGIRRLTGEDTLLLNEYTFLGFRHKNYPYGSMYEPQMLEADSLNRLFNISVEKAWLVDPFTEHGVLPYEFPRQVRRLAKAFEDMDLKQILRLSADIGHYVGDAHVPLHTTMNYNGQLTGQKGIHGFWESRIPELFAENYDYLVGKALPVPWPEELIWQAVLESHGALDSVLNMEKKLSESFPEDKKYGYESRNNVVMRVYSREYSAAYSEMLNGMVERRMRRSIERLGAVWYSAWVKAGKPDLSPLYDTEIDDAPDQYEQKLKIIDREAQGFGFNRFFEGEPLQEVRSQKSEVKSMKGFAGLAFLSAVFFGAIILVREKKADSKP
ncbi:MAG: zinc dependent phospholipase C family protein [Bacteroidia bacterium]